jgi:hypothetical protein
MPKKNAPTINTVHEEATFQVFCLLNQFLVKEGVCLEDERKKASAFFVRMNKKPSPKKVDEAVWMSLFREQEAFTSLEEAKQHIATILSQREAK